MSQSCFTQRTLFIALTFLCMNNMSKPKPSVIVSISSNKHVIGAREAGLFSLFLQVINHIDWCLRNNKIPVVYWHTHCWYYTGNTYNGSRLNAWEYYFEPVSPLSYNHGDTIHTKYEAPDGLAINWFFTAQTQPSTASRKDINERIIKPFIKLKPAVQEKIDTFFNNNISGKHTIGIHLRGTEKYLEIKPVNPREILEEAQRNAGPDSQFFIATDEEKLLKLAQKTLKGKVICCDSHHRAHTTTPLYWSNEPIPMDVVGEEVIIDAWLLSRCDKMIHTCSNVSNTVLFLNPELENVLLSAS